MLFSFVRAIGLIFFSLVFCTNSFFNCHSVNSHYFSELDNLKKLKENLLHKSEDELFAKNSETSSFVLLKMLSGLL